MFTEALSTDAKTWRQPKCLSTEEWVEELWCVHTQRNTTQPREEQNNAVCSSTGGPRGYHAKGRQVRE